MAESKKYPMLAGDCPRCAHRAVTFAVFASKIVDVDLLLHEAFCVCRHCFMPSTALLQATSYSVAEIEALGDVYINRTYEFQRWVFTPPNVRSCPDHVPLEIQRIFMEGATCSAVGCWDAAGTMFRKVLDNVTRPLVPLGAESLPKEDPGAISRQQYRNLGLRLPWLFDRGLLPAALRELSTCVQQDGNDAAHALAGITEDEATDLADFTTLILEALYTVPGRIEENKRRREERRQQE